MINQNTNMDEDFLFIERVTVLMDSKYKVPGTNFRFGIEPLINLIPFAGLIFNFFVSYLLVLMMAKYKVSGKTVAKMLLNVFLDLLISSIPFFGNFADFFFKANQRNLNLLKEHYYENKHQGSAWGIVLTFFAVVSTVLVGFTYLLYKVIVWFIDLLHFPEIFSFF